MFGLRVTTKRELAVISATILDLRNQRDFYAKQMQRERDRADSAVNLLLARTQKAVLVPEQLSQDNQKKEPNNISAELMNIFGDDETNTTAKELEKLQQ